MSGFQKHQNKAIRYGYGYSTGMVLLFVHARAWIIYFVYAYYVYMCPDFVTWNFLHFMKYNIKIKFILAIRLESPLIDKNASAGL